MTGLGKSAALALLRDHDLLAVPVREFTGTVDAHRIAAEFGSEARLVVRTATPGETRDLPRLAGATVREAAGWIAGLPPGLSVLIQPYEAVEFSVELASFASVCAVEIIPGVWELSNRLMPVALRVGEGRVEVWAPFTPDRQMAWFHTPDRGGQQRAARVEDWQVATVRRWIDRHHRQLAALRSALAKPVGIKLQYSARYGLSPQNIRTGLPGLADLSPAAAPAFMPEVSSLAEPVPAGGRVLLDVSVARERHTLLGPFITRLHQAGVREVYLRSGVLSHLAINLREAGLTVRGACG